MRYTSCHRGCTDEVWPQNVDLYDHSSVESSENVSGISDKHGHAISLKKSSK